MNPETEFREGLDELAVHYKEVLKLLGEDPESGQSHAGAYTRIHTRPSQGPD